MLESFIFTLLSFVQVYPYPKLAISVLKTHGIRIVELPETVCSFIAISHIYVHYTAALCVGKLGNRITNGCVQKTAFLAACKKYILYNSGCIYHIVFLLTNMYCHIER
jgi:hypothetical protein